MASPNFHRSVSSFLPYRTKFNALLKLLHKAISSYGRTNKVKAQEFDERLRSVVEAYNIRDKLVFTSEVVADFVNDLSDQLLQILKICRRIRPPLRSWDQLRGKSILRYSGQGT